MRTPLLSLPQRTHFLEKVSGLWPLAKGSLAEVRKPCIRANCVACKKGRKHPSFVFMFREAGRTRCLYVPRELVPAIRQAISNARQLETCLTQMGRELIVAYRQQRRSIADAR